MVLNKEKTGKILNSYEGMSPSSVWSAWNPVQKSHFLRDHFHTKGEVVPVNVYKLSFKELPESLKREISTHVYSGQYKQGGSVEDKIEGVESKIIKNDLCYKFNDKEGYNKVIIKQGYPSTNVFEEITGASYENLKGKWICIYTGGPVYIYDSGKSERFIPKIKSEPNKWEGIIQKRVKTALLSHKFSVSKGSVSNTEESKNYSVNNHINGSWEPFFIGFEINSIQDIIDNKENFISLAKEFIKTKKQYSSKKENSYENIISENYLSNITDLKNFSKEDRNAAKSLLKSYMLQAIKNEGIKKKDFAGRGWNKKAYSFKDGGKVEDKVYIDFLNKEKGFKKDRKYFKSYEEARKWALKNFDKFHPDMIKTEMATGGKLTNKSNNWEYSIGGL